MKPTPSTLCLALVSALLLFPGTLPLRPAAPQQSDDQSDSRSTTKSKKKKAPPAGAAATDSTAAAASAPPATARATKPASPSTPATSTAPAPKPAAKQPVPPPKTNAMVWVNTDSGVYHKPGTRYYGKTKQGKYMSEADAIKAGYRAAGRN